MLSIVEVKDLSKSFIISHEGRLRYTALRDVVTQKAKKIFSFPSNFLSTKQTNTKEEFWALKDVDFNIEQGNRVGIIGRNGAGKSTLLKILSRITEPTKGEIKIRGRVASLLEVGTGFHPELTGRENIFLNGAILGMSRIEIKKHFDAIVDFAEVDKFLDTPVKRYSSGMYVRLAFAIAAHLEPEILIVDEVLAVGDAQFQKKCLGKMEDVSKGEGRTILFVSHQLDYVQSLCSTCILLNEGKKIGFGKTDDIINDYHSLLNDSQEHYQGKNFNVSGLSITNNNGKELFSKGDNIQIQFEILNKKKNIIPDLSFRFTLSGKGIKSIFTIDSWKDYETTELGPMESLSLNFEIARVNLTGGNYNLTCWAHSYNTDIWECIIDNKILIFKEEIVAFASQQNSSVMSINYELSQQVL